MKVCSLSLIHILPKMFSTIFDVEKMTMKTRNLGRTNILFDLWLNIYFSFECLTWHSKYWMDSTICMLFYRWLIAAKASLDRTWPWRQWQWAFACSLIHDISSGCVYKSICNKKCRFCIQNIFTFIQADVLIASGKLNYPRINPLLPIFFLHRRGL